MRELGTSFGGSWSPPDRKAGLRDQAGDGRAPFAGNHQAFLGTVEEQVVSRPCFVRDGYFEDVNAAFHSHVGSTLSTSYGVTQYSRHVGGIPVLRQDRPRRLIAPDRCQCRRRRQADGYSPGTCPASTCGRPSAVTRSSSTAVFSPMWFPIMQEIWFLLSRVDLPGCEEPVRKGA